MSFEFGKGTAQLVSPSWLAVTSEQDRAAARSRMGRSCTIAFPNISLLPLSGSESPQPVCGQEQKTKPHLRLRKREDSERERERQDLNQTSVADMSKRTSQEILRPAGYNISGLGQTLLIGGSQWRATRGLAYTPRRGFAKEEKKQSQIVG